MIEGVVFDLGGVLGEIDYRYISRRYNEQFGVNQDKAMSSLVRYGQRYVEADISEDEFWTSVSDDLKIHSSKIDQMKSTMMESFRPNEKTLDLVKRLQSNYKLAIFSNVPKRMLKHWERMYFPEAFSELVSSLELGMPKGDNRTYGELFKRMQLRPEELVYVDDKKEYVDKFASFGGIGFVFNSTENLESKFEGKGLL